MLEKQTRARARGQLRRGKAATTATGEFLREEIHDVPRGRHGARSPQQAIAIGLSKARWAGVSCHGGRRGRCRLKKNDAAI